MSRGVLYIVWPGDSQCNTALHRSVMSLHKQAPDLPVHVHRFDERQTLLCKAQMFDLTPWDETLYLDADTVVLGSLDFGFKKAGKFGVACCINECPWAFRYGEPLESDSVEYNTGVLFFTRAAKRLFDRWKQLAGEIPSSIKWSHAGVTRVMANNDQASFAYAIEQTQWNPFVLPAQWNLRAHFDPHGAWFGKVRIWHSFEDVPPQIERQEFGFMDCAILRSRLHA